MLGWIIGGCAALVAVGLVIGRRVEQNRFDEEYWSMLRKAALELKARGPDAAFTGANAARLRERGVWLDYSIEQRGESFAHTCCVCVNGDAPRNATIGRQSLVTVVQVLDLSIDKAIIRHVVEEMEYSITPRKQTKCYAEVILDRATHEIVLALRN